MQERQFTSRKINNNTWVIEGVGCYIPVDENVRRSEHKGSSLIYNVNNIFIR
jgi:hypothetical protein